MHIFHSARHRITNPLRRRYDEHYHPRHRFGSFHLILDIVLIFVVASLVLYNGYLYLVAPSTNTLPIALTVHLNPQEPMTAGSTTIRIHYDYAGSIAAKDASIQVKLPPTYEISRAIPSEGFDGRIVRWSLGELPPKASGDLTLEGVYWGILGHPDELSVLASGTVTTPSGRSEQQYGGVKTLLNARQSAIETTINLPSTIVLNQNTKVSVTITNTNERSVHGLVLIPTTPSTWNTTKAEPSLEANRWVIPALGARASKTFVIEGTYARLPSSPSFFVRLERKLPDGNQEISVTRSDTTILDPSIELSAHIDGVTSSVNPGDLVKATIIYRNRGEFPLENVVVSAEPSGDYVDTATIETTGGTVVNGRAQWSAEQIRTLTQLVPDQGGELHFSIRMKRTISLIDHSPLEDFLFIVTPRASFRLPILPHQTIQWIGSASEQKMNSTLAVLAQTRYWTPEGEQIGRGPLPPRVGTKTTYWVTVNVSNTIHDLYETKVTIPLAASAGWTGRSSVSAGAPLKLDKATNSLIWTIGRLDNFLGVKAPEITATIELTVTPTVDDREHILTLLNKVSASGIDAFTKTPLLATSPEATTELSKDQRGGGKGVVQ